MDCFATNNFQITPELLGLSDVIIKKVTPNLSTNEIIIEVESTKPEIMCRQCGKLTERYGRGRTLRFRHLPMFGKTTYIEITPKRGRCTDCDNNPSTNETMGWYEPKSKMTKAFEQHLLFELVNSTIADVSHKEILDYHTVSHLIDRYIETSPDFSTISSLGILGFDEISLKKGHRNFVTLVTYRVDNKVHILGTINGHEKTEIIQFLSTIPRRLHDTVQAACCDLYEGYVRAIETVFKNKVPIVADRFHVRRLYLKSLVSLRKSEVARLRKELTPVEYSRVARPHC